MGTRQDVREAAVKYGEANVYVLGEFQEGQDVNAPAAEAGKDCRESEEGAA